MKKIETRPRLVLSKEKIRELIDVTDKLAYVAGGGTPSHQVVCTSTRYTSGC